MPTPMGHAIGGLAAAFFVNALASRPRLSISLLGACAAVAVSPDIDILFGSHRTYTHSIGAVAAATAVAWLVLRTTTLPASASAVALSAAYLSHLFLDWLGTDTSRPPGLMALWPLSSSFYMSGVDLFGEVSRRYWLPAEFVLGNMRALAWELVVLTPLLVAAWARWSKRTLAGNKEEA